MSDCACEICGGDHEVHFVRPAPAETRCDCEIYQTCAKCAPHLTALPSFPGYPQEGSKPLAIESFPGELGTLRRQVREDGKFILQLGQENAYLRAERDRLQDELES